MIAATSSTLVARAIPGDTVTQPAIDSARTALTTAGAAFQAAGTSTTAFSRQHTTPHLKHRDFQLQTVPAEVFERVAREVRAAMIWADDLLCRPRAILTGALLQQAVTGSMVAPADDAFHAGVVVARSHMISLNGWGRHEATVVRLPGHRGLSVFDPMLFDEPVSLTRWTQAVGTTPAQVEVESPFLGGRGPNIVDLSETLLQTWDRMPVGYTMPRTGLLDPRGTDTIATTFRASR